MSKIIEEKLKKYGATFNDNGYIINENKFNAYINCCILEKLEIIERHLRIFNRKTLIVEQQTTDEKEGSLK